MFDWNIIKKQRLTFSRREVLAGALVFFFGCMIGVRPLFDYDLFWHVANGREMLASGQIVSHEVFSFTRPGETFLNRSWLAQVIWFLIWDTAGPAGLFALKVLVAGSVAVLVLVSGRLLGASLWVAAAMAVTAVMVGYLRYIERPELFTLLLTALVATLLFGWRAGLSARWMLMPIPVLMVVWDWLHGAIFGFIYLSLFVLVSNIVGFIRKGGAAAEKGSLRWLNLMFVVTLAGMLANPWGLLSYGDLFSFAVKSDQPVFKAIMEFRPSTWDTNPAFYILVPLAVLVWSLDIRRLGAMGFFLASPFAFATQEYVRVAGVFAIICAPLVAASLSNLLADPASVRRWVVRAGAFAAFAYFGVNGLVQKWPQRVNPNSLGWGINDQYLPTGAVEFVKHLDLKGNLYNTGHFGGYLAYSLHPERKIFQYNLPAVFGDNYRYLRSGGATELERWNIQYAVVAMPDELRLLFPNQGWARIYRDMAGVLVVRRTAEHQAIIEAFETRFFNPMLPLPKLNELAGDRSIRPDLIREGVVYLAFRQDDRIADWLAGQFAATGSDLDPRYDRYLQLARAKNPFFLSRLSAP